MSEQPDIKVFYPRPPPSLDAGVTGAAVWAVEERQLSNYLLPRECPRVCFWKVSETTPEDLARLRLQTSYSRIIAVEASWIERIRKCELFLYEYATENFELADENAGYHISRVAETPVTMTKLTDLQSEFARRATELRVLPNLWDLRDQVVNSTFAFSVIRFRNAQARPL